MENTITKLRYIKTKNPDRVVEYTNKLLGYKVEIKGAPVYSKGAWFLWFVLPEDLMKEMPFGDID
jgi:hypothetical protein